MRPWPLGLLCLVGGQEPACSCCSSCGCACAASCAGYRAPGCAGAPDCLESSVWGNSRYTEEEWCGQPRVRELTACRCCGECGCPCANRCPGYKAFGCAGASNCEISAVGQNDRYTEQEWCGLGLPHDAPAEEPEEVMARARLALRSTLASMVWPSGWSPVRERERARSKTEPTKAAESKRPAEKEPSMRSEPAAAEELRHQPIHFPGGDPLAKLAPSPPEAAKPTPQPKKKKPEAWATILELAKMRESLPGLARALWDSPGALEALKEEVEAIYPRLSQPEEVTASAASRVCNAMSLLQHLASDQATNVLFLDAQFHLLVYPFLSTSHTERPFEYLRLTALGVIGALLKANSGSVRPLLETDLLRLCLNSLEAHASELSKVVAAFILQQLLLDDHGLDLICSSQDSLSKVTDALSAVVETLVQAPSIRLLKPGPEWKPLVRCYLCLTEDPRGKRRVKEFLPEGLRKAPESVLGLAAPPEQLQKPGPVTVFGAARPGPVTLLAPAPRPAPEQPVALPAAPVVPAVPVPAVQPAPAVMDWICEVCMRKFSSEEALRRHEQLSELHKQNLEKLGLAA
eukprot:s1243_g2.t1